MPKLPRVTVVQYGSTGPTTDFGQFGSKAAAAPQFSQDPSVIQQLAAWLTGWTAAAVGAAFNPYLEDMNGAFYVFGYYIANMFERGIPDWDGGTTYYKGAVVQDPAGSGQQFYSLTDNNLANVLPLGGSNAQWQWNNAPQVPVGTSLDFMGLVVPSGFLAEDGSALLRATYPALLSALSTTLSGNMMAGQPQIANLANTVLLQPGFYISGAGVPTGARILSIDSPTQVTMTLNALSNQVGANFLFAPWGVGDGTTTFNLPDTRRRVSVGVGGAGTAVLANSLGSVGGEETHTLTTPEMPSHTHTVESYDAGGDTTNRIIRGTSNNATQQPIQPGDIVNTGGGGPHNNMQPSYVVSKIIKF